MDVGTIQNVDIEEKMRSAYLSYAMSVITARALPDVRDGLKPGQRRILYAMHDMGIRHDRPTRKSARIVGEVLGKYHPHGDQAVYDAMVRMAQEFSLRYPLVEGQGNFGSIDGDSAAAMRYTEARLAQIGEEMLLDLDKDTVDFQDNFDGSLQEPSVLPSRLPNLLVNGVGGIAVGMATNIPPHNLGEVVDAIAFLIDKHDKLDDVTVDDLLKYIKGPDFPTAGSIFGCEGIRQAYATGKGRITVRALAHMEDLGQGRSAIIVTELPYQVNKSTLVERIATLVRDERIQGIADLRDESDRTGMRIVIALKRGVEEGPVMEGLLKYTQLQTTFGVNMLALVDGEPRSLPLKRCLTYYIDHRFEVIERRTRFELAKAQARAHVLEGLLVALDNLDEVISTIRRSRTAETARRNLIKTFSLSEIQAQAILDMQLRRLAALERRKIQEEYQEVKARIAYLQEILGDNTKILGIIKDDALELKRVYGDARRTMLCEQEATYADGLEVASMIPSEAIYALLTRNGSVRRLPEDAYRSRRTAVPGMLAKERDVLQAHLLATSQDNVYFATNRGRAFGLPAHQLPDADQQEGGLPLSQLVRLEDNEQVIAMLGLKEAEDAYLALATAQGKVKRLAAAELEALSRTPSEIIGLSDGDVLQSLALAKPGDEALLVTRQGKAIRFELDTVRPQGLSAGGMRGISLQDADAVVGMDLVRPDGQLVIATATGFAKRVDLAEYNAQGRGGQGALTIDASKEKLSGDIVAMCIVTADDEMVLCGANHKMMRLALTDIPKLGRATWGRVVTRTRRYALADERDIPVTALVVLPGLAGPTGVTTKSGTQPKSEDAPATRATRKRSPRRSSAAKPTSAKAEPEQAEETPKASRRRRKPSTRRSSTKPETKPEPPSQSAQDSSDDAPAKQGGTTRRSRSRRSPTRKPPTRRKQS